MRVSSPRIPRGRISWQRGFQREHGPLIAQKLKALRQAWQATRDPRIVVDAIWLVDILQLPRPPWLNQAAPEFAKGQAVDMGLVDINESGKVIFRRKHKHAGSRLGRPSHKSEVRAAAERQLRRADPGMSRDQFAEQLRDRLYPFAKDTPPTWRTVRDYISSPPSLWTKYVVEPRKPHPHRRGRNKK
jgi:hypothetical protein